MSERSVSRQQWQDYPNKHQARADLLAHIVLVPLFIAGNVAVVVGIVVTVVSLALQGRRHTVGLPGSISCVQRSDDLSLRTRRVPLNSDAQR